MFTEFDLLLRTFAHSLFSACVGTRRLVVADSVGEVPAMDVCSINCTCLFANVCVCARATGGWLGGGQAGVWTLKTYTCVCA